MDKGQVKEPKMKSQDIFILLKLVSLQRQEQAIKTHHLEPKLHSQGWEGWDVNDEEFMLQREISKLIPISLAAHYTARGLEDEIGVSKSEINNSIKRCISVGLAKLDRKTNRPNANTKALLEFIVHGLKYVFPAKPAEIVRGIPTSFAAPVLEGKLLSAGEFIYVWPDAIGKNKGLSVAPLFKSVPMAVKRDPLLYEYLALVDSIRLGNPREAAFAEQLLEEKLRNI